LARSDRCAAPDLSLDGNNDAADTNAADANALARGASYREVAELGWSIARSA